jgi:hypothetical protein
VIRAGLVLFLAVVVAGCGGGGDEEETFFTAADATRIANVRPVTLDWTWPQEPEETYAMRETPSLSAGSDHLVDEYLRHTAGLKDLGDVATTWEDQDKLANVSVGLFGSASDAHEAMTAANALLRGWGERNGRITKEEVVEGLGEEAWVLVVVSDEATEVTYQWRRDNLLHVALVKCHGSCPGDIEAAAREWADAIDEEASSAPRSASSAIRVPWPHGRG